MSQAASYPLLTKPEPRDPGCDVQAGSRLVCGLFAPILFAYQPEHAAKHKDCGGKRKELVGVGADQGNKLVVWLALAADKSMTISLRTIAKSAIRTTVRT